MKSFFLIVIILAGTAGVTYWYLSSENICPAPLSYRLGGIDKSFGLLETEALEFVTKAEIYWEAAADRELFKYDEKSDFTIDFVFDERQQSANKESNQKDYLDEMWAESEEVKQTVKKLQADYKALSADYDKDVKRYEASLSIYNEKVNKYNDRGGAPADIFGELEEERISLSKDSDKLNLTADELNKFAADINRLGDRGNSLVEKYNREVNAYNKAYGFAREFTQGDYHDQSIRIYKFSSEEEVVKVLAHEFGHALGIDHVEDPTALMYYLLEDTESFPTLSEQDIFALVSVCGEEDDFEQKARRVIRGLLNIL